MTFEQFGPEFMRLIISSRLLEAKLKEQLGAPISIDQPPARGQAQVTVESVRNGNPHACETQFIATLRIDLQLSVAWEEREIFRLDGLARFPLLITAQTYAPAVLHLGVEKVQPDHIDFQYTPEDFLGRLLQALWWDGFQKLVRKLLAERINQAVQQSEEARHVNFESMLLEGVPELWGPAGKVENRLEAGQKDNWPVGLVAGERLVLIAYLACDTFRAAPPVELRIRHGSKTLESTVLSSNFGWLGDFARDSSWPLEAPKTEVYNIEIHNKGPQTVVYKLRQKRTPPAPGERICFDRFGAQFLRQALSLPLLRANIAQALPRSKPIRENGLFSAEGEALLSLHNLAALKTSSADELVYRLELAFEIPELQVGILLGQETWKISFRVSLTLRIHPEEPLVLAIGFDPLTEKAIRMGKLTCLKGAGLFNSFGVLAWGLAGAVQEKLQAELDAMQGKLDQDLQKAAEATIQAALNTPPATPPQLRYPMLVIPAAAGTTQVVEHHTNAKVEYFGTYAQTGQTLRLAARSKLLHGQGFKGSVSLLDAHFGELAGAFLTGHPRARMAEDHCQLHYQVEESGIYLFRARIDPEPGTDPQARARFTLDIDVEDR